MKLSLGLLPILCGVLGACVLLEKSKDNLDNVLSHYDTLHTSRLTHTSQSHSRQHIKFSTLGRDFDLRLEASDRFASNFAAHSVDADGNVKPFHVDTSQFYTGHVHGEEGSRVTAHVSSEGVLSAHIATAVETYHIEPSRHYITEPHSYHMISYQGSHVKDRLSNSRVDFSTGPSIELPTEQFSEEHDSERLRRQEPRLPGRIGGDSCSVYLIAHYTYFNLLMDKNSVANSMISLLLAVDSDIFRRTEWLIDASDNTVSNLGLLVGGVLVHDEPTNDPGHYNAASVTRAGDILGRMRLSDWSMYCLAHLFVNSNFPSGLLGLANIASPSRSQTGGICSTRFQDNSFPGRPFVIYNTGLTSLLNRGQQMIQAELVRVTGHELGHNWGSHHDTQSCGPGWLMNEFAQDGIDPRNSMFSSCSSRSIAQVLLSKGFCFSVTDTSQVVCGNYRVDEGEDCDVGGMGDECCTPQCRFRNGTIPVQCSDQNSACCQGCTYAPASTVCRLEREVTFDCVTSTFCTGSSASCPQSPPAPDGAPCFNGICNQSVCVELCEANGMSSCQCSGDNECLLCCNSTSVSCSPLLQEDDSSIFLSNGAPCETGFCLEGNCTRTTQDEITRIWTIIVTLDINAFAELLRMNIVGCVLFLSLLLWCPVSCCVHYCHDSPLWSRFTKKEETDHGTWYSERRAFYHRHMAKAALMEEQLLSQAGLRDISEEMDPLLRDSSPVDDLPPPSYS